MKTFSTKLKELIASKENLNTVKLAKILGVTQPVISHWQSGLKKPGLANMQKIADYFGVSMDYLTDKTKEVCEVVDKKDNLIFIPKLNYLAGAGSIGFIDLNNTDNYDKLAIDTRIFKNLNLSNLYAVEIIGDSMEPEYYEKDVALIDMVNCRYNFVKIAGVYIVRVFNEVYIKRVEFLPKGGLRLISINKAYGDIIVNADDNYEILGKVCGKIHYEVYKGLTFDNQGVK